MPSASLVGGIGTLGEGVAVWFSMAAWTVLVVRPLASHASLAEIHLYGSPVADLSPLGTIRARSEVSTNDTNVSDLSPFVGLPELSNLSFSGSKVDCHSQVSTVSPLRASEAAELAALVENRRELFLSSEFVRELELKRRTANAQMQYARTTLPPAGDSVCQDLPEAKQCERRGKSAMSTLEKYLDLPPKKYDEQEAKQRFEQAKQTEIECVTIEQDCVIEALGKYGATARTRDLLRENFELLAQREKLQEELDSATSDQCLQHGQEEHAAYIIANYGRYARQPVEYFRIQIHRAFAKVHEAQIRCLHAQSPDGDSSSARSLASR